MCYYKDTYTANNFIRTKNHRIGDFTLEVGMRVIVRSNEPDPLMICKIVGFNTFGDKVGGRGAFPEIVDEADVLVGELKDLEPIEQWNYLVGEHGQIKEKYGIEYRTF